MDWSKAKTIIIIAFIITNMLLAYVLLGQDNISDPTLTEDFIGRSEDLLAQSKIGLATDIPDNLAKLNTITVNYEILDIDDLNRRFFKNQADIILDENTSSLIKDGESLVIKDRSIFYKREDGDFIHDNLNEDKVRQIARKFLMDRGYNIDDYSLRAINKEDKSYRLEFSKLYNDIFVERAYMSFTIDERGVRSFERQWLDVKDEGDKEIYIGTAPKAVLALLGREEFEGKTIRDISLCYFFDSKMEELLKEPVDSVEGRAVPAWRIEFVDGDKFIVDEY